MPDVDNLKSLSELFEVSVDYLLSEEDTKDKNVIRESCNLSLYGKGSKKKRKIRIVRERFPDAEIYALLGSQKLTKGEKKAGNLIGIFTDAPFGIPALINSVKNADKMFYLAEQETKQYLVMVTDGFIEIRRLGTIVTGDNFEVDNFKFKKCKYKVK